MTSGRTRTDLLTFLDYLGQKGLIPPATASARKASANKVLAILSEDEASDVTLLDLESVFTRFGHLHKGDYSPESLQTYVSRTRTSVDDFKRHCDDPLNFRPKSSGSAKARAANSKNKQGPVASPVSDAQPVDVHATHAVQVLPISIRSDVVVRVAGLPHNLTRPEAQKIANIILAHAMPDE